MALQRVGKVMNVKIDPRPFIMWQDEDLEYVKDLLGQEILIKSPINSQS